MKLNMIRFIVILTALLVGFLSYEKGLSDGRHSAVKQKQLLVLRRVGACCGAAKALNGGCVVDVERQFCWIIQPTQQMICQTTHEKVQGTLSPDGKCCIVRVDGTTYCVREELFIGPIVVN